MAPWNPSMAWPSGTAGGTGHVPAWGGYVRLWLRAGLQAGNPWHLGPHTYDRLDAGNVLGGGTPVAASALHAIREGSAPAPADAPDLASAPISRLWVDLTCDTLDIAISGGIHSDQGIFSRPDAYTLVANLHDPTGIYDPVNPKPPWTFHGVSRLVPGTPVECFAEVVDATDGSWQRILLFTGTADSWAEEWTPNPRERVAVLTATDVTKEWVNLRRPAQPPAGLSDTTTQRIQRIATFYGWTGPIEAGNSATTHAATELDATGWENLNATMDNELGVVHFTPEGALRWIGRDEWLVPDPPVIAIGCPRPPDPTFHDIVIDANPSQMDAQMRNDIYAARDGGVVAHVASSASISRHGSYEFTRTDLGVEFDAQAGEWASAVLRVNAYPREALEHVTLRPDIAPNSWDAWADVLNVQFFNQLARLVWVPPDDPTRVVDTAGRVVGVDHAISRGEWSVDWQLIGADNLLAGNTWTLGPHPQDRLDAANVMG